MVIENKILFLKDNSTDVHVHAYYLSCKVMWICLKTLKICMAHLNVKIYVHVLASPLKDTYSIQVKKNQIK